jgi:2-amino-4-hydroxy-6-hydroxymethyldihydropteridine diphosphokinase
MPEAILGLGGNVGDVTATLDRAVDLLCNDGQVRVVRRSSNYRTPPWGVAAQPPFINLCLIVDTALPPRALLDRAFGVERQLGRDRRREQRWGPRTIDIDLLAYDDVAIDEPGLTLPHPRLFERAFVLVPLAEIAGERIVAGKRIADAVAQIDTAGIERLPSANTPFHPG